MDKIYKLNIGEQNELLKNKINRTNISCRFDWLVRRLRTKRKNYKGKYNDY